MVMRMSPLWGLAIFKVVGVLIMASLRDFFKWMRVFYLNKIKDEAYFKTPRLVLLRCNYKRSKI